MLFLYQKAVRAIVVTPEETNDLFLVTPHGLPILPGKENECYFTSISMAEVNKLQDNINVKVEEIKKS
eukprot:Pgem_evm1s12424